MNRGIPETLKDIEALDKQELEKKYVHSQLGKNKTTISLDPFIDEIPDTQHGDPLDELITNKEKDPDKETSLWKAIDKLKNPYRHVIWLKNVDNLDYNEIAEKLNITYGNAKNIHSRGIAMLREQYVQEIIE